MKNLIYTICDNNYLDLCAIWYDNIIKHTEADICIITPDDVELPSSMKVDRLPIKSFDYKFTGKFEILQYDKISEYDNFLYLDLDVLAVGDIDYIFSKIENSPNTIHGVQEIALPENSFEFHRCNVPVDIPPNNPGFNAGTFGFNKQLLTAIDEFYKFVEKFKSNAICDQPLFNMFFIHLGIIVPSLTDDIFLDIYTTNNKSRDEYPLIHFLGSYGDINNKLGRIKNYV